MKKNKIPILYTSILYICGLLLFMEWLYPVTEIADNTDLRVFLIYTLFCFAISMLEVKGWLSMLLKAGGMLLIIHGLYIMYPLFSSGWFQELYAEAAYNIEALLSQHWYQFTPMFQSVLFLLLIWLMSYLIHYWFIYAKRIFLFVVLTFSYIAVLDTFTTYDGTMAIIRTFVIAFVALGMSNFFKEIQSENIHFSWTKKNPIWLLPLILIVLFSTFVGYASPKFEPQWADPVPFITNLTGQGSGGSIQKVGYGEDDSRLGGSFLQDYTTVFYASARKDHYWRVETKDVYTGKGWESSKNNDTKTFTDEQAIDSFDYPNTVETETLEAHVEYVDNKRISKLLYPYGLTTVSAADTTEYVLNEGAQSIQTMQDGKNVPLQKYTISYDYPSFDIRELRLADEQDDPEEIAERYTQLPRNLPPRVKELAEELTADSKNRYEMTRVLEGYFSSAEGGFVYQISNVPIPEGGDDYVDQFLFDSKAGYCDNFSSSMVVMLRTLGIPARWAKGFTSGEVIESGDIGEFDLYEVTNANAHSWVEVYFPGSGWVPFEPTQGFANLGEFHVSPEVNEPEEPEEPVQEEEEPEREMPELPEDIEEPAESAAADTPEESSFTKWHVIIPIAVLLLVGFVLYRFRFRLQAHLIGNRLERKGDAKAYQDAYHFTLKVLGHNGNKKYPGQTLGEFANKIDSMYATNSMGMLTNVYERMIYSRNQEQIPSGEITQLWKDLIKKIIG
ncbi:transglutaminase-like domain-containing protein [Ornithinibacillus gellani]|uniref:transglutaminase-like domain-containing protein n=1 Tax=Ornithinibacillus gellani TaxID=2293253 RepID=UPI001CC1FF34|nr:transglutaminase domain-containing protein [Ornithinibacillus gellani]